MHGSRTENGKTVTNKCFYLFLQLPQLGCGYDYLKYQQRTYSWHGESNAIYKWAKGWSLNCAI